MLTAADIDIVVIIPAFQQPGLLAEAILAVLDQTDAPPTAVVVVDDGCPYPATARTALDFAAAHPGRVFVLRQPNRGVSAARNAGIDFALAAMPQAAAFYFLDSDNRLHPHLLARAWATLRAAPPEVGWVYPDLDGFGLARNLATGGKYSLLAMLLQNYCDTGSMVRRSMLEAGLRFDESLSVGFEDWDFWLQAAGRGFSGQHLPRAGFRYRIRPESRNQMAERQRPALIATLYHKHAALLRPRALLALEAAEMPRFALHLADRATVRFLLDPAASHAPGHNPEAARRLLAEQLEAPTAHFFPATCCFAEAAALALLQGFGVLHAVFWWAERLLRDHHFVAVSIDLAEGPELAIGPGGNAAGRIAAAPLLFTTTKTLAESAAHALPGWAESMLGDHPCPRVGLLQLRLPLESEAAAAGAITPAGLLLREIATLGAILRQRSPLATDWRGDYRLPRSGIAIALRATIGLGLTLPRLPEPGQRDIAFLLPLFSFAGLEKVVLNQAAVLRQHGWRTHLVVAGTLRIDRPPGFAEAFDSVTLFAGLGESRVEWNGGYFGAAQSKLVEHGEAADALALLAGFDVVVNVHSLGCQALMAALRGLGVRTFGGLHLIERGPWGEPEGTFFVQAAYENAYDGVVVISDQLRDWCIAHGLPADKVQLVRNAPGYPARPEWVAAALTTRQAPVARPLQVLFLGRLDGQKGLDRLAGLIDRTRGEDLVWRVIGRAVLDDAAAPDLGVPVEPPVFQPEELDAAYAWADVVVVPSRFEGVPLVVLEAQRMGCVVIATEVGGVYREVCVWGGTMLLKEPSHAATQTAHHPG